MNLFNILHELDIRDLRDELDRLRRSWHPAVNSRTQQELREENLELMLRLGLLVRLLIAKGVFTAEEYAGLLAQARTPPGE
jgi:hypothetical protein